MTSNLVVAGSSPAGGAGQDNIDEPDGHYVGLYAENPSLRGSVAAQEDSGGTGRMVDADGLLILARSWERLAEYDDESRHRAGERRDHITVSMRAESAAMYRRHAAQVREIVAASGVVQP